MATQLFNAHAGASRHGEAHGIAGLVRGDIDHIARQAALNG